ncbi:hypothetical protein [Alicyclobacillus shizuokensis]|uniref:hypothetical protein n=1 Tax=Alicyclobacillus shizuokensis TaxID=392014 RepID=UPI00147040E6|nr:hypothetical protein [Alicyclobacillus shizuokensis]
MEPVKTPLGTIEVMRYPDDPCPGVAIMVDGMMLASMEYDPQTGRLRTFAYSTDNQYPIIVDVKSGQVTIPKEWDGQVETSVLLSGALPWR